LLALAMNHWFHNDMNYRGLINMLVMCGCVGQSGGGLVALCRAGEIAPANRLAALGVWFGIGANRRAK
jgi:nitrate reductase alpha subunit